LIAEGQRVAGDRVGADLAQLREIGGLDRGDLRDARLSICHDHAFHRFLRGQGTGSELPGKEIDLIVGALTVH
jgi:hypothetical protein